MSTHARHLANEFRKLQGRPSPLDVQNLLAAINKLEQIHSRQFPVDDQNECIPANSPTRDSLRLKRVPDALAGFCVSKVEDEIIALSVEYVKISNRKRKVAFFIASNSEVPDTTQQHLREM
ncbi:hypothetical protein ASPWEDRAFT_23872 [Aspergillus wentii DTO 134E9]|uniref:Uncharacterized protein n=1 Tax=Aspergillus wentii DTO 134E9 TaxID=1073089 RepID=A0A1L9S3T7_ASPWE|nr:uncharacterized protein ASPWEDRAFT_23872 [Aspergillus wentii DTO 134E9]OJJ41814.1 hypothetical protein ASPWEDRAFT_23872 [Aspergillus wentii DTO 134E9]